MSTQTVLLTVLLTLTGATALAIGSTQIPAIQTMLQNAEKATGIKLAGKPGNDTVGSNQQTEPLIITDPTKTDPFMLGDIPQSQLYSEIYIKTNFRYGKSFFTDDKYRTSDIDTASSSLISSGFQPDNEIKLFMEGKLNPRVSVKIDYNNLRDSEENSFYVQYKALEKNELLQEMNIGDIDIVFGNSKYATYKNKAQKGLGFDALFRKDRFSVKTFASISKGIPATDQFRGNSTRSTITLREYQYLHNRYFQIEPFKRYDNAASAPTLPADMGSLITFQSNPADPANYRPYAVNLTAGSCELYLDDQIATNNSGNTTLFDGGSYRKLSEGSEYSVNYTTGVIKFNIDISEDSRIYALYALSGSSTDPAVRDDIVSGKYFVFLKYGRYSDEYAYGEDVNHDLRTNYDIYEIKSYYSLGASNLSQSDFLFVINDEEGPLAQAQRSLAGAYSVNYVSGVVSFNLREPFRQLLSTSDASVLYSPTPATNAYARSAYSMQSEFMARNSALQLSHINVIPGTLILEIDGKEVSDKNYILNAASGIIEFPEGSSPLSENSEVTATYQYMTESGDDLIFAGGARAEYEWNRYLKSGASVIYSRSPQKDEAPILGSEAFSSLVAEADTTLTLSRNDINKALGKISGSSVAQPFKLNAYGEYAYSRTETNTKGAGIIDDFESMGDSSEISLSEKYWILSSPPTSASQSERGELLYKYYRRSDNFELQGESFSPFVIDYSVKPGPYNIKSGPQTVADSRFSLVFDYSFASGENFVGAATTLSTSGTDLSALQYLEVTYKTTGANGDINLYFDVGSLNEDSDGDLTLDTEDANRNGVLDIGTGSSGEDHGYEFTSLTHPTVVGAGPQINSETSGDGVLSTEDLNRNGVLDTTETVMSFPSTHAQLSGGATVLSVAQSDSSWKTARIYIDKTNLTDSELAILKSSSAMRIRVVQGTATAGKLFIASLKMVSSSWSAESGSESTLKISQISRYSDSDYATDPFQFAERGVMKRLYGYSSDEIDDLEEFALSLQYSSLAGGTATALRRFQRTMDFSSYNRMVFWVNAFDATAGDTLSITIGSSLTDTCSFTTDLTEGSSWQKINLTLSNPTAVSGSPDLRHINYINFSVTGSNDGTVWIDTLILDGAKIKRDTAYWAEATLASEDGILRKADGSYLVKDFNLKYIRRGSGGDFRSTGRTDNGISEDIDELTSSATINDTVYSDFSFQRRRTSSDPADVTLSDSERGKRSSNSLIFNTNYTPDKNVSPLVQLNYRADFSETHRTEESSSTAYRYENNSSAHSPRITLMKTLRGKKGDELSLISMIDLSFKMNEKGGTDNSPDELRLKRKETQYEGLYLDSQYSTSLFFLRGIFDIKTDSTVRYSTDYNSDQSISSDINGGYQIPFFSSSENVRYTLRNRTITFNAGLKPVYGIFPSNEIKLSNIDNSFRDYTSDELSRYGAYRRDKNSTTTVSEKLILPYADNSSSPRFIKTLALTFERNLNLVETALPFEGENFDGFFSAEEEEYGIRSRFGSLAPLAVNLIRYPFWHFFSGRGNFGNGRDALYKTKNRKITIDGNTVTDYDNTLNMKDSLSLNSLTEKAFYSGAFGILFWQNVAREQVEGIPQQTVNLECTADTSFNLAKLFGLKFPAPKKAVVKAASQLTVDIGYRYSRNMLITSNILEQAHTPSIGFTALINDSSIEASYEYSFRWRQNRSYIPLSDSERAASDDIYYANLPSEKINSRDQSSKFKIEYKTGMLWLYDYFASKYLLFSYPIFKCSYSLVLNRYDYEYETSPEPYDAHIFSMGIDLNIHENIKGELNGTCALERWHNRDTGRINKEIVSYEGEFSLIVQY